MKRLLLIALLSFAAPASAEAAGSQARQCWLDAMSDAEKRSLVEGYARIQRNEGKARAEAWANAQRVAYTGKAVASGVCPPSGAASTESPAPSSEAREEPRIRNRYGKPCKRIELENQNVPNIGGSMGWALVQVCKD